MRRFPLALVIATALTLTACGGDDGASPFGPDEGGDGGPGLAESDGDTDGGGGSNQGGDPADGDGGSGGGEVAGDGDFPIPIAEGVSEVIADFSGPDGVGSQRQLAYPADDFDRVAAFYDDWANSQGDATRTESGDVINWFIPNVERGTLTSILVEKDFLESDGDVVTFVILVPG